jgi:pimeloyl-ACP methyl ester carboxylesterase
VRPFEEISPRQVQLADAAIGYRELGHGPPIVFVHGLLTNGTLWRNVANKLQTSHRCIVPDWPLGAHTAPTRANSDLSPRAVARMIAGFLDALGLQDVTLVANDTGGAIAQMVAAEHPERLGRLVLTPCDAFENFLPPMFRPLQYAARVPRALRLAVKGFGSVPSGACRWRSAGWPSGHGQAAPGLLHVGDAPVTRRRAAATLGRRLLRPRRDDRDR